MGLFSKSSKTAGGTSKASGNNDGVKVLRAVDAKEMRGTSSSRFRRIMLRVLSLNISREHRQYFLENLSMQTSAGLDILQALEALQNDVHVRSLRRVIKSIAADVAAGASLASAIQATGLLSEHVISLIRIGESSGKLSQNLEVLAIEQQKEREFQSRIRSALFYPVFVLGLTVTIGLGIAWFILPNILNVFEQIDAPMPLPTRILIQVGNFFQEYGYTAVPAIVLGGVLFVYFVFMYPRTRFIGQRFMFSLPGIRRLMTELEIARMGYILGTLLTAGLPIVDAIDALAEATSLHMYKRLYKDIGARIAVGETFHDIFQEKRTSRLLIPITIQQIIVSAEQSGSLPPALTKIGMLYENKTENTTKNVSVMIEPILLVIVWMGVVLVALSVVLPIYSLVGNLNNGTY